MSKAGIQFWGPNLDEGPESLFNVACRMTALILFQKIAVTGDNFLNFNPQYKDDMLLFINAYNQYIHHVLAQKYHSEMKKPGSIQAMVGSLNASRNLTQVIYKMHIYQLSHWN